MICDMGYRGYKSPYDILPHFIEGRPDIHNLMLGYVKFASNEQKYIPLSYFAK